MLVYKACPRCGAVDLYFQNDTYCCHTCMYTWCEIK